MTCPGCRQTITESRIADSRLIAPATRTEPLVECFGGHIHLHRVTVLHIGEERLLPTLRREAQRLLRRWVR